MDWFLHDWGLCHERINSWKHLRCLSRFRMYLWKNYKNPDVNVFLLSDLNIFVSCVKKYEEKLKHPSQKEAFCKIIIMWNVKEKITCRRNLQETKSCLYLGTQRVQNVEWDHQTVHECHRQYLLGLTL